VLIDDLDGGYNGNDDGDDDAFLTS